MKNKLMKFHWRILSATAMMTLSGVTLSLQAQNSPVGTWDCVLSGGRQGTALFEFFDDGTFDVVEIMVPNTPNTSSNVGRGGTGVGRNGGGGSSTNVFVPSPQIFGEEVTNGIWALDEKGRTIGFFEEVSIQQSCTTTPIPFFTNSSPSGVPFVATNGLTTDPTFCVTTPTATNGAVFTETEICFTNVTICTALSNSVSFVGTVTAKSIILNSKTPFGNTIYRGVPAQALPDISGLYSGIRKQAGVTSQEFLNLTADGSAPNLYDVELTGPGYSYFGQSILSSQKRISFALALVPTIPTNPITVVRAVTGPFNAKKASANTTGWDQPTGVLSDRERFDVQPLP